MKNAVIFHGMGSKPTDFWFPWLKKSLEKEGYKVFVPQLPYPEKPDLKFWLPFALSIKFDKNTVLVGHSAGCPLILALLEKVTVTKAILVSGYCEEKGFDEPILKKNYEWEKMKKNCQEFIFINSINDPWGCNDKQGRKMFDKLGGLLIINNDGHMGSNKFNQPYKKFSLLLKLVL